MRPDNRHLPKRCPADHGTWFWQIECEFTPLPYGPYPTQWEAEENARQTVASLMTSDRAVFATLFSSRHGWGEEESSGDEGGDEGGGNPGHAGEF